MTPCGKKLSPAFNERPLVSIAAGLALGTAFGVSFTGTQVLSAACLSFALFALSLLVKRRGLTLFCIGCALGFARLIPYALIMFSGSSPTQAQLRALSDAIPELPPFIKELAKTLQMRCDGIFDEVSPLVRAILLGDRTELTYLDSRAYRACGISHILALSGLHVSVLSGAVLALLPKRRPLVRLSVTALFLALYCAIAGFPSSLLRASVITLCMLLAPVFNRKNDPASSLALAFILIVAISPFRLFSAGFQLSFAASAGAVMLTSPIDGVLGRKLPSALSQALSLTFAASLATLPFTVSLFGALPLYSPLTNLIIVPMVTLALPIALAALALSFIWYPLGVYAALPVRLLLGASDYLAKAFSTLPFGLIECSKPSVLTCALFLALLLSLSKFCLLEARKKYTLAAGLASLFALSAIFL